MLKFLNRFIFSFLHDCFYYHLRVEANAAGGFDVWAGNFLEFATLTGWQRAALSFLYLFMRQLKDCPES